MTHGRDGDYAIPVERFDNVAYIEARVSRAPESARGVLRTALKYVYLTNGPVNLPRDRHLLSFDHLERREQILAGIHATYRALDLEG